MTQYSIETGDLALDMLLIPPFNKLKWSQNNILTCLI